MRWTDLDGGNEMSESIPNIVREKHWIPVTQNWTDWAWTPPITNAAFNFVAAYRPAEDGDIEDAESDAIFEAPPYPDRSHEDYWYIVYLPLDEPEEFLLRENYNEEEVRRHVELKCKLFAVEQRAIERLNKERNLWNKG